MSRSSSAPRPVLAVALAALLLGGCADGAEQPGDAASAPASSTAPSSTAPSSTAATPPGPDAASTGAQVPELLEFTATTVSGEAFDGASLAGRPTLFWFWAPWCPTCRGQIPQVEAVAAEHGDQVNVVGIGSLDSAEAISEFAADAGAGAVTHLEDVDGELWTRFGVTEQSSFVLLDADGAVVLEAGYGGTDELGARVGALVG